MAKKMRKVTLEERGDQLREKLAGAVGPIISDWKTERERHGIHGRKKVEKTVTRVLSELASA